MIKLGKLSDYATVLLAAMAADSSRQCSAHELSQRTHIAAPTVAKLMKKLQKSGLIHSVRGVHGGYRLARSPQQLTVADIIYAIDGPIALTDCAGTQNLCSLQSQCTISAPFKVINAAVLRALQAVTLADISAAPERHPEVFMTFLPTHNRPVLA